MSAELGGRLLARPFYVHRNLTDGGWAIYTTHGDVLVFGVLTQNKAGRIKALLEQAADIAEGKL